MEGIFTISLDFELHWGGFEKWPISIAAHQLPTSRNDQQGKFEKYFLETRDVIPKILNLFEKYKIHVTWATVGMLLHTSKQRLMANSPALKPTYLANQLSAYHYINEIGIGDNEENDPFHFAPSIINQILLTPNQELGSHSFSHFYCNEPGQTVEQFREDLKAAKLVAADFDTNLRSLVFPRNQFNDDYLKVCFEEGVKSVRSNPADWFWHIQSTQNESTWKRLNRGIDAYFPIGKKNSYKLDEISYRDGYPVCLPASRLLRPYRPAEIFLNDFKIKRIKSEMVGAAKLGEVYHLWWHPHNFGEYPSQSLTDLEKILECFSFCQNKYDMQSLTMGETSELIATKNGKAQIA